MIGADRARPHAFPVALYAAWFVAWFFECGTRTSSVDGRVSRRRLPDSYLAEPMEASPIALRCPTRCHTPGQIIVQDKLVDYQKLYWFNDVF